jgi:hypothetical protein
MQRLEGVVDLNRYSNTDELKRYALFFDKLHVIEADILHASFLAGESYILVSCPVDFIREDSPVRVGVGPAEGFGKLLVGADVFA